MGYKKAKKTVVKPVNYKGFKLEVTKYEGFIMGAAIRISDGWVLDDTCTEDMKMRDMMADLKWTVDDYIKNPNNYDDDVEGGEDYPANEGG